MDEGNFGAQSFDADDSDFRRAHSQDGAYGDYEDEKEYAQFSFPSFSPKSKKRVRLRKPNFSDDCIDLLISLVNEHRDILYIKKANTSDVHERKIMVWTHITSQINAISTIPRTMEEVRKKWNDYSYYVKKKRESEQHDMLCNPETSELVRGSRKDTKRVRQREDRILNIVTSAMNESSADDNFSDPCTYSMDNTDFLINDGNSRVCTTNPTFSKPSLSVPSSSELVNNFKNSFKHGSDNISSKTQQVGRTQKVSIMDKLKRPPAPGSTTSPVKRAQGKVKVVGPIDEKRSIVNRKLLSVARKSLTVAKSRLRIEQRRLDIEELRFTWQQMERERRGSRLDSESVQNKINTVTLPTQSYKDSNIFKDNSSLVQQGSEPGFNLITTHGEQDKVLPNITVSSTLSSTIGTVHSSANSTAGVMSTVEGFELSPPVCLQNSNASIFTGSVADTSALPVDIQTSVIINAENQVT